MCCTVIHVEHFSVNRTTTGYCYKLETARAQFDLGKYFSTEKVMNNKNSISIDVVEH